MAKICNMYDHTTYIDSPLTSLPIYYPIFMEPSHQMIPTFVKSYWKGGYSSSVSEADDDVEEEGHAKRYDSRQP